MITIAEVIEQAAQIADEFHPPGKISAGHAIRALAKQYEGYRVIEPDSVIYKQIADNYAREPK